MSQDHLAPPLGGETVAGGRRPVARVARGGTRQVRHRSGFTMLALPGLLFYAVAVVAPLLLTVQYSFYDYNLLTARGFWVGLDNYSTVLTDPDFWTPFLFTVFLTAATTVFANAGGVGLAALLNRQHRSYHALRTVSFVPVVLSGVVVAYIWSTILTDRGILNSLLANLGLSALQHSWLGTPLGAQVSVAVVSIWPAIGFCTVVYLAGFQAIPPELLEAAALDGASGWQTFRNVSWPLLLPALVVNVTVMVINGFKAFDTSVVLTGGGPYGTTETAAMQILQVGFTQNKAGYASAAALVVLTAVALLSAVGALVAKRAEA